MQQNEVVERVSGSCSRCRDRKKKCNGQVPCSSCIDRGEEILCTKYRAQRIRSSRVLSSRTISSSSLSSSSSSKPLSPQAIHSSSSSAATSAIELLYNDSTISTFFPFSNVHTEEVEKDHSYSDNTSSQKGILVILPIACYSSMPTPLRLSALLATYQAANPSLPNMTTFDLEQVYIKAFKPYDGHLSLAPTSTSTSNSPHIIQSGEGSSFSQVFFLSCVLLYSSTLNDIKYQGEFQALLDCNDILRSEVEYWPVDLRILQGFKVLVMALIQSSSYDQVPRVIEIGFKCAISMGLYHPSEVACFSEDQRRDLIKVFLHLINQACDAHSISCANFAMDLNMIDIDQLVSQCTSTDAYLPHAIAPQRFITQVNLQARAFEIIEAYFYTDTKIRIDAPTPEQIIYTRAIVESKNRRNLDYTTLDRDIEAYLEDKDEQIDFSQWQDSKQNDYNDFCEGFDFDLNLNQILPSCPEMKFTDVKMQFLRIMINYPYSFNQINLQKQVITITEMIFDYSTSITSSIDSSMDAGSVEQYLLISIQCLALLERYKEVQQRQQIDIIDPNYPWKELMTTIDWGAEMITNMSNRFSDRLKKESTAWKKCQNLLERQWSTSLAGYFY